MKKTTKVPLSPVKYYTKAKVRHAYYLHLALQSVSTPFFFPRDPWPSILADTLDSSSFFGLTEQQAKSGQCYVAPILVSKGDILPVNYNPTIEISDISLGDNVLHSNTPLTDFVHWVIDNNPSFIYGDCISLIYVKQSFEYGIPVVKPQRFDLELHFSPLTLGEAYPEFFDHVSCTRFGDEVFLDVNPSLHHCAFAFVHSGMRNGIYTRSTQHLFCRYPYEPLVNLNLMYDYNAQYDGLLVNFSEHFNLSE